MSYLIDGVYYKNSTIRKLIFTKGKYKCAYCDCGIEGFYNGNPICKNGRMINCDGNLYCESCFDDNRDVIANCGTIHIFTVDHIYKCIQDGPLTFMERRYFRRTEIRRKNLFIINVGMCEYCKAPLINFRLFRFTNHNAIIPMTESGILTIDHILPKFNGIGSRHSSDNFKVACNTCNTLKGNMIPLYLRGRQKRTMREYMIEQRGGKRLKRQRRE